MNKPFTASEVRSAIGALEARDMEYEAEMLQAYADRLEADEKAVPVYQLEIRMAQRPNSAGAVGDPLECRVGRQPTYGGIVDIELRDWLAQNATEADLKSYLGRIGISSYRAYAHQDGLREMARYKYADAMLAARAAHSAQAQPPAARVTVEMVMRLKRALPLFCADITMADAHAALEAALTAQENHNG